MKLIVTAIGLLKTGPEKELAADYEQRLKALGRQAGITEVLVQDGPESKAATAELRKAEEAKKLWSHVPDGATAIALDERGKALTSVEFSDLIKAQADNGCKALCFLIGGPDGHAPETHAKAMRTISFGPMTFPHRLLRVMLLEQLYRSVTIMLSHPYHRV